MSAPHWHIGEWIVRGAFVFLVSSLPENPSVEVDGLPSSFNALPAIGVASWYSESDPGIKPYTASGELFSDEGLTAATWNVPLGSCVRVTNLKTLSYVFVRINDRGPSRNLFMGGRLVDLSKRAFQEIANLNDGVIPVQVEVLSNNPYFCSSN